MAITVQHFKYYFYWHFVILVVSKIQHYGSYSVTYTPFWNQNIINLTLFDSKITKYNQQTLWSVLLCLLLSKNVINHTTINYFQYFVQLQEKRSQQNLWYLSLDCLFKQLTHHGCSFWANHAVPTLFITTTETVGICLSSWFTC